MGSKTLRVRALGFDTPETKRPGSPVECFGPEATAEARRLLEGHQVLLESDPTQERVDRYGRTLAHVRTTEGTLVGDTLISAGFAVEYTFAGVAHTYQLSYRAAQADATAHRRGMWAAC